MADADYRCVQCGPDPNGPDIHHLTHHRWPPLTVEQARQWCTYCEEHGHTVEACTEQGIPFDPDWVVPTWVTLHDWLTENGMTPGIACATYPRHQREMALERVMAVLADEPAPEGTEVVLGHITGVPVSFWRNLEHNYRVGLAAGKGKFGFEQLPGEPSARATGGYQA